MGNGVGILLDKRTANSLKCFVPISERIIMIKLAGHPFDINIMQVYLPTSTCNDEDVEEIYEAIEEILK